MRLFQWPQLGAFFRTLALAALLAGAVFAAPTALGTTHTAYAQEPAPEQPAPTATPRRTVTVFAVGFVDVAGGSDPSCPGCDGEFGADDEKFSEEHPLPELDFVIKDKSGMQLATGTSEPLANLQRAQMVVSEPLVGEEYILELVAVPDGWQLCSRDPMTRTLTISSFQLGSVREDWHFWKGCDGAQAPTATPEAPFLPTSAALMTAAAQATPPVAATNAPPFDPDKSSGKQTGGSDSNASTAATAASPAPASDTAKPTLAAIASSITAPGSGSIKGVVFRDDNQDGVLGPDEPGLNEAGVYLRGAGVSLHQLTSDTGQYSFDGLGAGKYDVWIQSGPAWRITTKSRYQVEVDDNSEIAGIDFGRFKVDHPATGGGDLLALLEQRLALAALLLGVVALLFSFGWRLVRSPARAQ